MTIYANVRIDEGVPPSVDLATDHDIVNEAVGMNLRKDRSESKSKESSGNH